MKACENVSCDALPSSSVAESLGGDADEPPDTDLRYTLTSSPPFLLYTFALASLLNGVNAQTVTVTVVSGATASAVATSGGDAHDGLFVAEAILIPILVICSGIVAGLTLGYMSLDMTQINVLIKTGSPKQQANARAIEPIRRDGHLLLVTLLLTNMILNETLPVVSDNVLGGGVQAVVVSTALVVIFSEIIPQSVCSRYGLAIGARMVWPTRILIIIFYPLAKPIAMLLTWLLGAHSGIIYRRSELKELITMHADAKGHGGDLKADTITIVGATLDLQEKTVRDAMTPISEVFMLDVDNTRLDYPTLSKILQAGYSRIPVFENLPQGDGNVAKRIKGVILVKQFILLDPEDATPLRELPIHPMPAIADDMPLLNILNSFQEGRSHLAIVAPRATSAMWRSQKSRSLNVKKLFKQDKERSLLRSLFRRDETEKDELAKAEAAPDHDLSMPADAKWSRSSLLIPLDEDNPLGVISLEDVIEELIGEPIADETDAAPDGTMALQPYMPPEALEAIQNVNKPVTISPSAANAIAPSRPLRSTLAQTLLGGRPSPVPSGNKESHATTEMAEKGRTTGLPRLPRLGIVRSRSAPGRKRSSDVTVGQLLTTPSQTPPSSEDPKLLTLSEKSYDSSSDDDSLEKVERRLSLDDHHLPLATPPTLQSTTLRAPPAGLANALLLERGRRHLAASGQDMSTINLRVVPAMIGGFDASSEQRIVLSPSPNSVGTNPRSSDTQSGPLVSRRSHFKSPAPTNLPTRHAGSSAPPATPGNREEASVLTGLSADGLPEHSQADTDA